MSRFVAKDFPDIQTRPEATALIGSQNQHCRGSTNSCLVLGIWKNIGGFLKTTSV